MTKHTYVSKTPEADALVCDCACEFVHGLIANFSGEDLWIWLCDSSTKVGDQPSGVPIKVANGDSRSIDQIVLTRNFSKGLYVLASRYAHFRDVPTPSGSGAAESGLLFQFSVNV